MFATPENVLLWGWIRVWGHGGMGSDRVHKTSPDALANKKSRQKRSFVFKETMLNYYEVKSWHVRLWFCSKDPMLISDWQCNQKAVIFQEHLGDVLRMLLIL